MKHILYEQVIEGKRLGRHINHDPRSRAYAYTSIPARLSSAKHESHIGILDQEELGSCTGESVIAALGCSPMYETLTPEQQAQLNQPTAVKFYSYSTSIDPFPGTWEPEDTGSDGTSIAKTAQHFGFISGYEHALSLDAALAALVKRPIIVGMDWFEGFDEPSSTGLISATGATRGGHEVCFDQIDATNRKVWFRNSWGEGWGVDGRANMTFDTFGKILANNGDATILVPVTAPAPVPTDPEGIFIKASKEWISHRHVGPYNSVYVKAVKEWLKTKGI